MTKFKVEQKVRVDNFSGMRSWDDFGLVPIDGVDSVGTVVKVDSDDPTTSDGLLYWVDYEGIIGTFTESELSNA